MHYGSLVSCMCISYQNGNNKGMNLGLYRGAGKRDLEDLCGSWSFGGVSGEQLEYTVLCSFRYLRPWGCLSVDVALQGGRTVKRSQ